MISSPVVVTAISTHSRVINLLSAPAPSKEAEPLSAVPTSKSKARPTSAPKGTLVQRDLMRHSLHPPKPPKAYNGTEQYVVRCRLKLRSGLRLDSAEAGILQPNTYVCVMEVAATQEGLLRARVAICSASGEMMPMGWISYIGRDGRSNLIPFHWARFARPSRPIAGASTQQLSVLAASRVRTPPAPPIKAEGSAAQSGAEHKTSMGGALSALAFSNKLKLRAEMRKKENEERRQMMRVQSTANPIAEDLAAKQAEAEAKAAEQRFKVQPALEVHALGERFRRDMEREQNRLGSTHSSFKVKLGEALFQTNAKISELVKSWFSAKPEINRMDFRKHVRKVLSWENVKEIDNLFVEIDEDGGGSLDSQELTMAMKKLRNEAASADERNKEIHGKIRFLTLRVERVDQVVKVTQHAELQEDHLQRVSGNRGTEAQLGYELRRRSTKITDLVNSWESTNGEVDMMQFRRNVRAFGIEDTDESLDELFHKTDLDGGGTLDLEEIRTALVTWKDAMTESDKDAVRVKKSTAEAWKIAKAAQMLLDKQLKEDENAEAEKRNELARLEQERHAAEERARAAEEAKQRAIRRKKEAEEAAYAAKIEQKRREIAAKARLSHEAGLLEEDSR